jgi:hypothetical protein
MGAWSVRGNHDDAALSAFHDKLKGVAVPSKQAWVDAAPAGGGDPEVAYLESLPFSLVLPELGVAVVHAGESWGVGAGVASAR